MTLPVNMLRPGYAVAAVAVLMTAAAACGADRLPVPGSAAAQAPYALAKAGGDAQTAPVTQPLPAPLTVRVTDAAGRPLAGVKVTWSTTGAAGSLAATSSVTDSAGRASTTWTLGRAAGSDTATAVVSGLPRVAFTATALAGSAASVAKQAGDLQSAAAGSPVPVPPEVVVKDAFGNAKAGVTVTFAVAAGGGTVTGAAGTTGAGGTAAAGGWTLGSAGTNALTATVAGTGISGNPATFTATATATAPPTTLLAESFADTGLAGRGWYDLAFGLTPAITTAEHIPGSPASLEIAFDSGGTVPTTVVRARHQFTPSNAVYLRYWVKYSANWIGSGKTYHPHEFYFTTTEDPLYVGPSYTHLTTYVEDNYQNGGYAVLAAQDGMNIDTTKIGVDLTSVTENRAVSGCNGNPDNAPYEECYLEGVLHFNDKRWKSASPVFLPDPGQGYKGDWHEVEAYFQLNSIKNGIGQLDGIAQYWIDGQQVINYGNVLYRTGAHPTMQFDQLIIGFYIGDGSPVAQQVWLDDLVVMTGRP